MTEEKQDIQEVHAEEVHETETPEVVTVESTINNALVKQNVTDKVIANFKEKFGSLKIKDVNDREGYREVVEARKEVKQLRVLAVKVCKNGREDAVKTQKAWIAKEKEVVDRISEIEDYLQEQEDNYNTEKARLKREEEERLENQRARRSVELTKLGAQFTDGSFVLDDVQFDLATIREVDEKLFQSDILPKFQEVFDKKEAARIEQEKKEKEEKERAEKQARELAVLKEQRTTARGNELLAIGYVWKPTRSQFEYKDIDQIFVSVLNEAEETQWSTVIEGAKKVVEEDTARLKALAEKQERYDKRVDELSEMQFVFVKKDNRFKCYHVMIDDNSVRESDEEHWEQFIIIATEEIKVARENEQQRKEEEEKQRVEQERLKALGAVRQAELRAFDFKISTEDAAALSETDYLLKLGEAKTNYDKHQRELLEREQKEKQEKEEKERQENENKKTDTAKWNEYIAHLLSKPVPEFRSGQYRTRGKELQSIISQIKKL